MKIREHLSTIESEHGAKFSVEFVPVYRAHVEQLFNEYLKPDPGPFLHAAKIMGHEPHACAVVEDSLVGIHAAKATGMVPILYDPKSIHEQVEGVSTISSMSQLAHAVA